MKKLPKYLVGPFTNASRALRSQELRDKRTAEKQNAAKSQHTPGPWAVTVAEIGTGIYDYKRMSIMSSDKQELARTTSLRPILESEANAYLIAAAPELLKTSKVCLAQISFAFDFLDKEKHTPLSVKELLLTAKTNLQAAVAKAEGGK